MSIRLPIHSRQVWGTHVWACLSLGGKQHQWLAQHTTRRPDLEFACSWASVLWINKEMDLEMCEMEDFSGNMSLLRIKFRGTFTKQVTTLAGKQGSEKSGLEDGNRNTFWGQTNTLCKWAGLLRFNYLLPKHIKPWLWGYLVGVEQIHTSECQGRVWNMLDWAWHVRELGLATDFMRDCDFKLWNCHSHWFAQGLWVVIGCAKHNHRTHQHLLVLGLGTRWAGPSYSTTKHTQE